MKLGKNMLHLLLLDAIMYLSLLAKCFSLSLTFLNSLVQLLLDVLTFCSASFTALVQYPSLMDDTLMNVVESSLLEQLNLTKDSLLEIEVLIYGIKYCLPIISFISCFHS